MASEYSRHALVPQVMVSEEKFGRPDLPVWIERTAVGSSSQALLACLLTLRIDGEVSARVLTRMAEVLKGLVESGANLLWGHLPMAHPGLPGGAARPCPARIAARAG